MERLSWLLKMAFKSLVRRKSRTFLVLISLTLASALATVFFSFPVGARLGLGRELRAYGANLVIAPLTQETGSAGLSLGQVSESSFLKVTELKDYLKEQSEVKEVNFQLQARGYYRKTPLVFLGMERRAFQTASRFWKIEGRLPLREGEALAGTQLRKKFGWNPGQKPDFELRGKIFNLKIVGVAESGGFEDNTLMIERENLSLLAGKKDSASKVLVRVEPASKISSFEKKLKERFPELKVSTFQQVIKREESIINKVEKLLFLATIFVLIATSISIANTTSTTVVERWREIGLLKSLGSSNWVILEIFLLEAFSLAFLAAFAGFLLGWFLTQAFALSVFSLLVPFVWLSAPASFLISFFIVFASSIWPLRLIFQVEPALVLKGQ